MRAWWQDWCRGFVTNSRARRCASRVSWWLFSEHHQSLPNLKRLETRDLGYEFLNAKTHIPIPLGVGAGGRERCLRRRLRGPLAQHTRGAHTRASCFGGSPRKESLVGKRESVRSEEIRSVFEPPKLNFDAVCAIIAGGAQLRGGTIQGIERVSLSALTLDPPEGTRFPRGTLP